MLSLCGINLCPAKAMQMACFTEYGQPYRPRWPELVVKSKTRTIPPDSQNTEETDASLRRG